MQDRIVVPGFTAIVCHSWRNIVVGKLVPVVIFLAALRPMGLDAAVLSALAWSIGVVLYQRRSGRRVAGLVILSIIGNMSRSVLALLTGSVVFYLAQPTISTFVIGLAFLVSIPLGQPLAGRLIQDFCPFDAATLAHPEFGRFFRSATVLWSFSSFVNGGITIHLLLTRTITEFLVIKSMLGPALTAATLSTGFVMLRRRIHRVGLHLVVTRRVDDAAGSLAPSLRGSLAPEPI